VGSPQTNRSRPPTDRRRPGARHLHSAGKTGKRQLKLGTPRLKGAIHRAKLNQGKVASVWIVHARTGQRYTRFGFETVWGRARDIALKDGAIEADFTFHDLEAKGISDYVGDKQKFSGHSSRRQMERYNRKPEDVIAPNPHRR
jgi:hypothetical protein